MKFNLVLISLMTLVVSLSKTANAVECSGLSNATPAATKVITRVQSARRFINDHYAEFTPGVAAMTSVPGAQMSKTSSIILLSLSTVNVNSANPHSVVENLRTVHVSAPLEKEGVRTGDVVDVHADDQTGKGKVAARYSIDSYKAKDETIRHDMRRRGCDADHYFDLEIEHHWSFIGRVNNDGSMVVIPWYTLNNGWYHFKRGQVIPVDAKFIKFVTPRNRCAPGDLHCPPGGGASVGN